MASSKDTPEIAIVGGGIVGLILAAGLIHRGVQIQVYEQSRNFREIGAGIGFSPATTECMRKINPDIVQALHAGGGLNMLRAGNDQSSYLRMVHGYGRQSEEDPNYERPLLKIDSGAKGWAGIRRDRFLENLAKSIPADVVHFRKRLETIIDEDDQDKVILEFNDGSRYQADAVIAADGIKSTARKIIFGEDHPASSPQYTHRVAYRTLVPAEKVVDVLGEYKGRRQLFHLGPDAHIMHYPVNKEHINISVFIHDLNEWPLHKPATAKSSRGVILDAFAGWSEPVRNLLELLPEEIEQWALFDTFEYPLPKYNKGRICLAGDAAHGSSPHYGAGASMGVEDVLCLCSMIPKPMGSLAEKSGRSVGDSLRIAFETFNHIRRRRSQWLVNSSRWVCDFYQQPEWGISEKQTKAETLLEEYKDRALKLWNFDHDKMEEDTICDYQERMERWGNVNEQRPAADDDEPNWLFTHP